MTDCGFPVIEYARDQSPREWGRQHGESYRTGIRELVEIRLNLLRERNSTWSMSDIHRLANEQWVCTEAAAPELAIELEGICEAAEISREEIVILNNYTDFRDIQIPDQGCSVVFVNRDHGPIAGQTWDMHRSAKNYVCCLRVPLAESDCDALLFSLVGCVGMMGYTSAGNMVGVNNINTDGATAGALWPVVVRRMLQQRDQPAMASYLSKAPVTSGHNYLLASAEIAEMWEVMPGLSEIVDAWTATENGSMFHTNHCLGSLTRSREQQLALNSTTQSRYQLLKKKIDAVASYDGVYALLNDHEGYPKSICSNFQSNAQDPSVTCGGAVGHLKCGKITMWRGDEQYDDNFVRHDFQLT